MTEPKRRIYRYHVLLIALTAAISLIAVAVRGATERSNVAKSTSVAAPPRVAIFTVGPDDAQETLTLPTSIEPAEATSIYARASGYVSSWSVDIGSPVRRGQVLARIESPEIDQQLEQARADAVAAEANADLATRTQERWKRLLAKNLVSRQDADDKASEAVAKAAIAASVRASHQKLQALSRYRDVTAPFDGVITSRTANVGQLVSGNGEAGARELFRIASTARLRALVHVPQAYAGFVAPGMAVDVTLPQHGGDVYAGTIDRTATVLDPDTRNMLVQILIDAPGPELRAGSYAEARLHLAPNAQRLKVPSAALLFRSSRVEVALVGANDVVTLKPVTVGHDTGSEVEVLSGVSVGDRLIVNAPDSLAAGETVTPVSR